MNRGTEQDWIARALVLTDLGRLDDAEEALREAVRAEPDDGYAHALLSLVLAELDDEEALASASAAIALAPELPLAHAARAQALLSLDRSKEAEASAAEAVRLDPEDAENHTTLGAVLLARERWDEAREAAEKALSLDPDSERALGLRTFALAMSAGGDWEEAADRTLAVGPASSIAHSLVGHSHLVRGGEAEAVERFREALRLDPASEHAQAGLAEATKASHPLFKPLFRFFMWQERLSTGWKLALLFGPLVAIRALRPAADNPIVLVLIVAWMLFVVATWLSVPIANVALRFSTIGRSVLPADQKRSSSAFVASVGACLLAVVLAIAIDPGFAGAAFALGLLAFPLGSAHAVARRGLQRAVYVMGVAAGVASLIGGALFAAGLEGAAVALLMSALLAAIVLFWVVRLG